MSTPARLFLIDGSSQMYRAYHAMRGSGLSGPGGRSTHAVYIFVTMLRKLMQDHDPRYIAASFDLPGPTFRSEMATDYKANRTPMPPDLAEQIPWVHEACEALGVPILTSRTFEADDVIGTLAMKAHAAEITNKRYREGLLNHADDARQSRELARIRTDVPVDFDPAALQYRGASRDKCFELFGRLGFRSLVMEFAPTADTVGKDYVVVDTAEALSGLIASLRAAGRCAFRVLP